MNRHSRKQLVREVEAYLAFWAVVREEQPVPSEQVKEAS